VIALQHQQYMTRAGPGTNRAGHRTSRYGVADTSGPCA
ncbi:uncharacterized protein METZ01_LOCUS334427, partial [marine metagenome]